MNRFTNISIILFLSPFFLMGCQNVNLNQVDSTESVQITSTTDTTICEENTTTVMNTENKMIHEITCEGAKANGSFSKTVTFKIEEVHDDDLQATIDRDYWYDSVKILDFVLKDEAEQATADFQTDSFSVKVIKDANYHVYYADGASMVELNSSFENGYVTFQPNPGILRYVLIERTKSGFRYEDGIWYMDMEGFWFTPGQWPSDMTYDEHYAYFSEFNDIINDGGIRYYYGSSEAEVNAQSAILSHMKNLNGPGENPGTFYAGLIITSAYPYDGIWVDETGTYLNWEKVEWNIYKKGNFSDYDGFYLYK